MEKLQPILFLKALFENFDFSPWYQRIRYKKQVIFSAKPFINAADVIIIKDIPDYLSLEPSTNKDYTWLKVNTLKGHSIQVEQYSTLEKYLAANFSAKSRSNLRRYTKRLETCFNIRYECYWGSIPKEEYHTLFKALNKLLVKRFAQKKEVNYELQHLADFEAKIYAQLRNKEAALYVIYHHHEPISIRINMIKENLGFYMMSAYDIDYAKFHLGSIDMMKNIGWCIEHNMLSYDLLKGYDYYKKNWMTQSFDYYNHIIYNHKNSMARLYANYVKLKTQMLYLGYYGLKKINADLYYKSLKQFWYTLSAQNKKEQELLVIDALPFEPSTGIEIKLMQGVKYEHLKKIIFDFLFNSQQSLDEISIFEAKETQDHYQVIGKKTSYAFIVKTRK
ncbi:GNAT family N-acetyltransferase [Cellulophaga sp. Hel_I_12]|uniref:GNAT family N-acetyltransferase n=1 Tax=Cellulophaga sp. Hel_I_12 TaxID=1249972 RepID=UPI000648136B|nr:GNAT family N-acetyltransferase [Cellulophaga sp. Hel_I_12]